MARAANWAFAGAASLALHAAGLAGLALSVRPDEVAQQTPPPTEVVLAAEPVRRAEARPATPEAAPVPDQATEGLALHQDAPRRTQAAASAPPETRLAPRVPQPQIAAADTPEAVSLAGRLPDGAAPAPLDAKGRQAAAQSAQPQPSASLAAGAKPLSSQAPEQGSARETRPPATAAVSGTPTPATAAALDSAAQHLAQTAPAPRAGTALPAKGATALAAAPAAQALLAQRERPTASALQAAVGRPLETRRPSTTPVDAEAGRPVPVRFEPPSATAAPVAKLGARPVAPADTAPRQAQTERPPAPALADLAPAAADVAASASDAPPAVETDTATAAPRLTAALAWQAGAESEADPVSMAAIQAFMQPEALSQGDGKKLRDGLAALLADIPCARVQTEFRPETATLELRGHIPEDGLRGPLLDALQAQMGGSIRVADEMRLLPAPQCGALAGIAAVGLPQSDDQRTNPLVIGENAHVRAYAFREGDPLELELVTPDYEAVVYIDYFDAAGNVIHLQPNETVPLRPEPPASRLTSGIERSDRPFLRSFIAPPFAEEIVVAFASSAPLYDGLRPLVEPAAPYLADLAERVADARARTPDFKGEWVYFFVETGPRN